MVKRDAPGYVPSGWPDAVSHREARTGRPAPRPGCSTSSPSTACTPRCGAIPSSSRSSPATCSAAQLRALAWDTGPFGPTWATRSRRISSTQRSEIAVRREGASPPPSGPLSLSSANCGAMFEPTLRSQLANGSHSCVPWRVALAAPVLIRACSRKAVKPSPLEKLVGTRRVWRALACMQDAFHSGQPLTVWRVGLQPSPLTQQEVGAL
jgi:hypothetical protein